MKPAEGEILAMNFLKDLMYNVASCKRCNSFPLENIFFPQNDLYESTRNKCIMWIVIIYLMEKENVYSENVVETNLI